MPDTLDIIFCMPHPDDVEIITPASPNQPGRARLAQAKVSDRGRVLSHNGGDLIGYVAEDDPWWPYNSTYWLEVSQ